MFRKCFAPALLALTAGLSGTAAAQPPVKSANVKLPSGAADLKADLTNVLKLNVLTGSVTVNEKTKKIFVTVKNTGATKIASLDVRATVGVTTPIISPPMIGFDQTQAVKDLAPGQTRSMAFDFDLAAFRTQMTQALLGEGTPRFVISGIADPAGKIGETNESDNVKSITVP